MKKKSIKISSLLVVMVIALAGYFNIDLNDLLNNSVTTPKSTSVAKTEKSDLSSVSEYEGNDYIEINNNVPEFTLEDKKSDSFESYSELDSLGRCGPAFANVSKKTMPKKKRENISSVKPTGWQVVRYRGIEGGYLYNRCHLIAHQLTGEDANKKNLITCTRYMNASVMLKFEQEVANYVKNTNNHVLYRVSPYFKDDELVARGVQMEAYSIEDNGKGISFNVFVYNVQDGFEIDYQTGKSKKIK